MTDVPATGRRRILQTAGIGGMAFIAGCSSFSSDDEEGNGENGSQDNSTNGGENGGENGNENGGENGGENGDENGSETREAAVRPTLNQEALQSLQQQFQQEELSQEEYISETEAVVQEDVDGLQTYLETETEITVEDQFVAIQQQIIGVLRISGAPTALIDLLQSDQAESLIPASQYDEIVSQLE